MVAEATLASTTEEEGCPLLHAAQHRRRHSRCLFSLHKHLLSPLSVLPSGKQQSQRKRSCCAQLRETQQTAEFLPRTLTKRALFFSPSLLRPYLPSEHPACSSCLAPSKCTPTPGGRTSLSWGGGCCGCRPAVKVGGGL